MKKILLFTISICYSCLLSAQQPTIHSFTFIPQIPTSSSTIQIVTHISTPNASFLVDKTFTVSTNPNYIKLRLCYGQNLPTVITHQIDTFNIGQLPPGNYPLLFTAYISSAGQHCVPVDSNYTTNIFTVGSNVGLKENTTNAVNVYPNPAKDYIVIEGADQRNIRIYSVQGKLVRVANVSATGKVSLEGISEGMYLIELNNAGRKEFRRLLVN